MSFPVVAEGDTVEIDLLNGCKSFNRRFRNEKVFRRNIIDIIKDPKAISRGMYDERGIDNVIKEQLLGKDYGLLFKALVTIEVFFKVFVDNKKSV